MGWPIVRPGHPGQGQATRCPKLQNIYNILKIAAFSGLQIGLGTENIENIEIYRVLMSPAQNAGFFNISILPARESATSASPPPLRQAKACP